MPKPDPVREGQVSVWSFPRPAIAEETSARIVIAHRGTIIADTTRAVRTLETSHPPSYYLPQADIAMHLLRPADGNSFCEWKGAARYWDVFVDDTRLPHTGWNYPSPTTEFAILRDLIAFYASHFDTCSVDGMIANPQAGHFYGERITPDLAGPFKGGPGSMGW